jgi:hypothetical protein
MNVCGKGISNEIVDDRVQTKQIAPTILKLLGLNPTELDAVKMDKTQVLPDCTDKICRRTPEMMTVPEVSS